MEFQFVFLSFLLGLCFGSFSNSVIARIDNLKSLLFEFSKCPNCGKRLRFWNLIPLFSFAFQKGKCSYCKKPISFQYPLVEVATGILFSLFYLKFGLSFLTLKFCLYSLFLIPIFVIDLKRSIIPDKLIFPAIALAGFFEFISFTSLDKILLGIIFGSGFFLFLVLISKEKWMGWGDVKLGIFCGLVLKYPLILVSLAFSFIFGALVGIILIGLKKKTLKDEIPFGPFLIFSTFLAILIGKEFLKWYLGF